MNNRNRKFIEEYELKGDGSLADTMMRNAKKLLQEQDATTPAEKRKQKRHYQKKMAEIVNEAAKAWPMPGNQDD